MRQTLALTITILLAAFTAAAQASDKDRAAAAEWLRTRSTSLTRSSTIKRLPTLDDLGKRAKVIGFGEASHGSREANDLRFDLTRYLIERHGFRIVAIEASSNIINELSPYFSGRSELTPQMSSYLDFDIWIGKRTRRELFEWVRKWNRAHANDRVEIVGVDPQIHVTSLATLRSFLTQAYSEDLIKRWEPVEKNVAEADAQTVVFGDSGVSPQTRDFLFDLVATLKVDRPLLLARFGAKACDAAIEAAEALAEFADFNAGDPARPVSHSRDWYMAKRTLSALQARGASAKLVLWAHNAHVAHTSTGFRTTGTELRDAIGCQYAAVAATFDEGSFVAQIRNDPQNRLAAFSLPLAQDDSVESVVRKLGPQGRIAAWPCNEKGPPVESGVEWFRTRRPMHWIGGIYNPESQPSASFRNFDLLRDFDGLVFLPHVTAEDLPKSIPNIPPRKP